MITAEEKNFFVESAKAANGRFLGFGSDFVNSNDSTNDGDFQANDGDFQANVDERAKLALDFLQKYYCGSYGYGYLWLKNKITGQSLTLAFDTDATDEISAQIKKALDLNLQGYDVYFSVNVGKSCGDNERHKKEDVTEQIALVVDIDVATPNHHHDENKLLPPNVDTAKKFLPLTPTFLISSGGGLHAYYKFQSPLDFSTADDKDAAALRGKKFLDVIRNNADVYSKSIDSVQDLPRILRLPFSLNCKDPQNLKLCEVVSCNIENLFTPAQIDEFIDANKPAKNSVVAEQKENVPAQNFSINCATDDPPEYQSARIEKMKELINPADLVYSDWLAVVSSLKNLGVPYSVIDEWNKQDAERYDEYENKKTFDALNDPSFDMQTLHGIANKFGYKEGDFKRQWYKDNPQFDKRKYKSRLPLEQIKILFGDCEDNDLENAKRILSRHEDKIRWLTDAQKWAIFDGKSWTVLNACENSVIYPFATKLAEDLKSCAITKAEMKIAKAFTSRRKISSGIELIKGLSPALITQKDLNTHDNLLNCQNGIVDLETGILYPHDATKLFTQMINAEYRPNYHNEVVEKFLQEILPDDETRFALLRFLGYCLTGEVNAEKALFFSGGGGNGKGTLTGTILKLLGSYGVAFPIKACLARYQSRDADAATPAFAKLLYVRLAIAEEIPQGEKLDTATFKLLTGGDQVPIRRLHEEASTIEHPTHKLIFSGNYLPELQDNHDEGLIRRLMRIDFKQKFSDGNRDDSLKKKLWTPDALSGLFTLLVENATAYYKHGLLESKDMKDAKTQYLDEQDFISDFIDETCVIVPNARVRQQDLLTRLRDYSDKARGLSDNALRKMLTQRLLSIPGVSQTKPQNKVVFCGIGLVAEKDNF